MANYSILKAAVEAVVKTNGNEEITGANLQSTLESIIGSLGADYQFAGVATTSTSPGTPDQNVAYIGGAGTYTNFGSSYTVKPGSIGLFKYNGSWTQESFFICDVANYDNAIERERKASGIFPLIFEQGGLNVSTGAEYTGSTVIRSNYVAAEAGMLVSLLTDDMSCRIFCYDSGKGFLSSSDITSYYRLPTNTAYIRLRLNRGSDTITPADAGGTTLMTDSSYIGDKISKLTSEVGVIDARWAQGGIDNNGETYSTSNAIRSSYIPVSGKINICNPNGESWKIYQYDSNQDFVSYQSAKTNQYFTSTLNSSARYVRIQLNDSEGITPDRANGFYVLDDVAFLPHRIKELQDELNAAKAENKSISILFVGNSLTQDGIAYLPYMLRTYYPFIEFKFYMWYNGGYTLAQQYTKFTNDETAGIFSVCENATSWTNYNSSKKMSDVLTTYKFDVVCMQEYFNYKSSYTVSDLVDWNNCRDYITSHYTGGNGLEFISLFHAPLRSSANSVEALTSSGNALILQQTISQDMIPIGIAVYNALSTSLDSLGDQGHLSPDGTHTQEGLPCLLQTYTALCWLFDRLAINKSVYGCPMRMTTEIYNTINVPGPNLGTGVITGTDAQNILAQEVAIQAYKEGKSFVAKNIYVQ